MSNNPQYGRRECYFCDNQDTELLETHHIVPRRFGGSNTADNLVDVCPTCHRKLERLYDNRFYHELGVEEITDNTDTKEFGTSKEQRDRISTILDIIESHDGPIKISTIIARAENQGISESDAADEIEKLADHGEIYHIGAEGVEKT